MTYVLRRPLFAFLAFFAVFSFSAGQVHAAEEQASEEQTAPAEDMAKDGDDVITAHAIALHGAPKYAADFTHVDYVNPDAPKGGTLRIGTAGTFDSLNPFIVKGNPAPGMTFLRSGHVFESLMQNSWDEPFTLYGVLAESITLPKDRSWVSFKIRDEAKWNDGVPITAEDVVWTFKTLKSEGQPFFKAYWGDVESVTADSEKDVTFKFKVKGNAELPLIIAEMSVLPKHYWEGRDFQAGTVTDIPLTSGPYKFGKIDAPRSIEYVRNENWWGKDLPFYKGKNNFDRIVYDLYRDQTVMHEAFISGAFDYKMETSQQKWVTDYDVPAVKDGRLIKEKIDNERPAGMQAYIYNLRRPLFQDVKVRKALNYAVDFEWSNQKMAYGEYKRTNSYFENSELASHRGGLPSEGELEILNPLKDQLPPEVFTEIYKAPVTDGSGNARANLRDGIKILEDAGWVLGKDKIRRKTMADGTELELKFEIIDAEGSAKHMERWVLPFLKNLERMGVKATFRPVDAAQFQERLNTFDFDVIIGGFGQSNSPGNEQREFWSSEKADMEGSRNYAGIKNPAIDVIIEQIIKAESREDLVTKVRALDRVLLWNHYVIPMWYYDKWRIAYWAHIKRPENLTGIAPLVTETWWYDENAETPAHVQ